MLAVEQYNVLKMFVFLWATSVLIWPRPLRFRVAPKSVDQEVFVAERRALVAHLLTLGLVCLRRSEKRREQ